MSSAGKQVGLLKREPELNRDQLEEFVRQLTQHQRSIYCYILTLLPHYADAEEVLQNTNMVLWRKADAFQAGTSFYRWASTVARLEVLKWRERRSSEKPTFSIDFIEDVGGELTQQGDLLELRYQALAGCLQKLRESDRRIILMRYAEGATTKTVAETMDRPIKSIYTALARIRGGLLDCINRTISRGASGDFAIEGRQP